MHALSSLVSGCHKLFCFAQANARVDLVSPLNDISRFPQSCYPASQRCLARLEALTGESGLLTTNMVLFIWMYLIDKGQIALTCCQYINFLFFFFFTLSLVS